MKHAFLVASLFLAFALGFVVRGLVDYRAMDHLKTELYTRVHDVEKQLDEETKRRKLWQRHGERYILRHPDTLLGGDDDE